MQNKIRNFNSKKDLDAVVQADSEIREGQRVNNTSCMLGGMRLFSDLPLPEQKRISTRITARRYAKGEKILHRGNKDRSVYFVIAGRVKAISYAENGKQVSFEGLGAGDSFGELTAIDSLSRSTDVIAIEDCLIGVMSQIHFLRTNMEYPDIALKTMQRLTRLARNLLCRITEFSTLNVNNRVRTELLRIAASEANASNSISIQTPPTHEEIACRISTHREAVTREIKRLESEGVITWNRGAHKINDLVKLKNLVGSDLTKSDSLL